MHCLEILAEVPSPSVAVNDNTAAPAQPANQPSATGSTIITTMTASVAGYHGRCDSVNSFTHSLRKRNTHHSGQHLHVASSLSFLGHHSAQ